MEREPSPWDDIMLTAVTRCLTVQRERETEAERGRERQTDRDRDT